jgi:hypothetical protein
MECGGGGSSIHGPPGIIQVLQASFWNVGFWWSLERTGGTAAFYPPRMGWTVARE